MYVNSSTVINIYKDTSKNLHKENSDEYYKLFLLSNCSKLSDMFREVYTQAFSYIRQSSIGCIEQHVRSYIILWSHPLAFEYAPQCLGNVQLWRVWWQIEKKESPLFPYRTKFPDFLVSMDRGVVEDDKCIHLQIGRDFIKETDNFVCCHFLGCCETLVAVVPIDHSENIETCHSLGGDVNIFPSQLPAVRDISFCASVAFVSIIEPDASFIRLSLKFLQLLDLVFIELRRGDSPWAFSYSLISCANADKKRLNVASLTSLPEDCSHAALALLTLCLSCSITRRTASSSELSIIGFRPRPERVFNPSMPSNLKRFTQAFTLTWLISVCAPMATDDRPSDFSNTARQRIRKQCFSPKRNPLSSARRSVSANPNAFGFPITVERKLHIFILCKLILFTYL